MEIKIVVEETENPRLDAARVEQRVNTLMRDGWKIHSIHVSSATIPAWDDSPPMIWTTYTIVLTR